MILVGRIDLIYLCYHIFHCCAGLSYICRITDGPIPTEVKLFENICLRCYFFQIFICADLIFIFYCLLIHTCISVCVSHVCPKQQVQYYPFLQKVWKYMERQPHFRHKPSERRTPLFQLEICYIKTIDLSFWHVTCFSTYILHISLLSYFSLLCHSSYNAGRWPYPHHHPVWEHPRSQGSLRNPDRRGTGREHPKPRCPLAEGSGQGNRSHPLGGLWRRKCPRTDCTLISVSIPERTATYLLFPSWKNEYL